MNDRINPPRPNSLRQSALRTIAMERDAVDQLASRINSAFEDACHLILGCNGRVVVMGMGKSGHIGNKLAATLASTGTPAMFVHPAEASHGDIGMITQKDVVLLLSNSGTTPEMLALLPVLKRKGVPLISIVGNLSSPLAQTSTIALDATVQFEACPLGLAPTTSTTVALVFGDALAMALLEARGFSTEDFAFSHPGGNLGRRLLLKVADVMHEGGAIPTVEQDTSIAGCLIEMTRKKLGLTTVLDNAGQIAGVFTDGDLRRFLDQGHNIHTVSVRQVMTNHYKSITVDALASEAAKLMQDNEIYSLVVLNSGGQLTGVVTMHDLLKANVI